MHFFPPHLKLCAAERLDVEARFSCVSDIPSSVTPNSIQFPDVLVVYLKRGESTCQVQHGNNCSASLTYVL